MWYNNIEIEIEININGCNLKAAELLFYFNLPQNDITNLHVMGVQRFREQVTLNFLRFLIFQFI